MSSAELQSLVEPSVQQVRRWLDASRAAKFSRQSAGERRLASLLRSNNGLDFAVTFVDRVVRPEDLRVAARELNKLAKRTPKTLPFLDRISIRLGGLLAPLAPFVVIPIARLRMRQLVGHLVVDARDKKLRKHISRSAQTGHRLNLNLLGEAVLGEHEATSRFDRTFELLRHPDVDYVSVKLSSIVSQLSMWGYRETVARLVQRLTPMYEYAASCNPPKFINLDMEEYRDLSLTIDVFKRILSEPKLRNLSAGIVIQCYLPDALQATKELWAFAQTRIERGGAALKVRVVKGANLAMERVDAEWHGWQLATYSTKVETDANYKRVLEWLLDEEHLKSLRVGIAGHNLFDIAFAKKLIERRGLSSGFDFEMLQGMATNVSQVLKSDIGDTLLYTPVVAPKDFRAAIAYLIRRLEENGSSENFMSGLFDIATSEEIFNREAERFRESVALTTNEPQHARRRQRVEQVGSNAASGFVNQPDTDASVPANRAEVALAVARGASLTRWPRPLEADILELVHQPQIIEVLNLARTAQVEWAKNPEQRRHLLLAAADLLEQRRTEILSIMVAEAGKTATEADPEISEAIDFARFYALNIPGLSRLDSTSFVPNRVTVVVPPWNFPVAIPAGGVLAALAAGSSVVLKPAPQVPACSLAMVQALWDAGVPLEVLQIVTVADGPLGLELVSNPLVDGVVLTGSHDTARLFIEHKPGLRLAAETSGKNSMIISPSADLDLAASDLAKSAFGHAGQKCSAASVAILVGSVAKSESFKRQLVDAVKSMKIGREAQSVIGPLIEPPSGKLLHALTQLEPGESWLLEPKQLDTNGYLWSPGIRVGVKPNSFLHMTEVFGPVLAIMTARNLREAIEMQNAVEYGLTAGLQSLDRAEIAEWRDKVVAGNLYVNRTTTGAIVERQPFGGWKRSSVGWGLKAGGLNYLFNFGSFEDGAAHLGDGEWLEQARLSDERWMRERFAFGIPSDQGNMKCEANIKSYHSTPVVVLVGADVATDDRRLLRLAQFAQRAMQIGNVKLDIAFAQVGSKLPKQLQQPASGLRVVTIGDVGNVVDHLRSNPDVTIFDNHVYTDGLITGLMLLRERATSITTHRFGNTFTID